jgi:pimeloyl-ACP methyl ester carboxylesterase
MHKTEKLARAFYSGSPHHPIYVDHIAPPHGAVSSKTPVIMVHGGFHNGSCYLATPDGRPGWAPLFAAAGHSVLVPDWRVTADRQ